MGQVRVWLNATRDILVNEIMPLGEPALMRGLMQDWPIVAAGQSGPFGAAHFLAKMAKPEAFDFTLAPPESEGILHYQPDMRAFTFSSRRASFAEIIKALITAATQELPATIALQSLDIEQHFAGFCPSHSLKILPPEIKPRIWIGNRTKVATHNDPLNNIACAAAGRRRFTLFPPDQIGNLYMGPLHVTPAGTPISMVQPTCPDLDRFPRFADAMKAALFADLEPGDALFLPYQWYHHVEARDPFNVLVNYWWNDTPNSLGSPWDAMLHAIMAIRNLPPEQRRAWRANFDHYVFLANGDPGAHLPDFARGILGPLERADLVRMRQQILDALSTDGTGR